MKRFTLILTLFLMAAMPMMAERVTPETARKVATTFLNNNGAKVAQLTDLSKAAGFPNLYIFNANPGFVVMSADDCVRPILGYSLTNVFVAEGMPENIKGWLQGYSDQIQDAIDNALTADASVRAEWQSLKNARADKAPSDVVVGPLIKTLWDQTYPYNKFCPAAGGGSGGHVYTGCVATAMAQVMKFWNYPTTGNGSHTYTHPTYGTQTADFGSTTYDWGNMPVSLSGEPTTEQSDAVATLMYHCGVSVDMNYGTGSSGAQSSAVPGAMIDYFRYSPSATLVSRDAYTDAQWIAFLKHELDEGRPLYYSGSNVSSGHAFVCDGYRTDDYFHFNWGWSGYDGAYGEANHNNGYWAIGSLSPGAGGSGSGSGTYNLNNAVIAWAEPDYSSVLASPTLSAATSEGTTNLTWTSVAGAASYDVYKDNAKIASGVTALTYADADVSFGEFHDYFVRAISGVNKSNPSNFVTVHSTYRDVKPSGLSASYTAGNATLSWTGYTGTSTDIHYGLGYSGGAYKAGDSGTYWGQFYPTEELTDFGGMSISHASLYVRTAGDYTLYIYKDNIADPANELLSQNFTASSTGWYTVDLASPVPLDASVVANGLWVAFYSSSAIPYPATYGSYTYNENAQRIGQTLSELNSYIIGIPISWTMKVTLTDGTYTYHLYDNGVSVADNIDATSYVVSSPANNTAHQYTVKTKYYGGESAASNTAGLTLGEATLASLSLTANDKLILTEGSQLTVTGTISNANAANLVIEDGAQLVHNGGDVEATIQKNISAWSAKGGAGWHLIASPVDEVNIASTLATGTYDLYGYHEPTHHWLNYKKAEHASFFDDLKLRRGKGYLYAHEDAKVVSFAGSMKETDVNVAVPLSWESSNETLKGWNLVGNPYSCNAYSNVAYYVMNAAGNGFESKTVNDAIPPCTGIFVRATGGGQSVTFSTTAPSSSANNGYLNIALDETNTRGSIRQDNAIVSFNEGEELSKFVFNEENAEVYFTQSNEDYAIAYSDKQGLMSLNFKARHDGTYTLSFTADVISSEAKKSPLNEMFSYLHLIDKRTDSDIDLLAMPSYTFEAKASDNASRFTLVFDESGIASVSAEPFAYVSNGNIIINAATDKATLQMIDVTGRIVVSYTGDAIDHVSTSGMTPGVYVLRLVRGENIKTQKIVIE